MSNIINSIIFFSQLYGLDPNIALSVAIVETNMNHKAIGQLGEIGLFQVRPEFTGYSKTALKSNIGIMVGIQKLVEARDNCVHKNDINWLVCYNYGSENAKKVKHPHLFPYVKKVKKELERIKNDASSY